MCCVEGDVDVLPTIVVPPLLGCESPQLMMAKVNVKMRKFLIHSVFILSSCFFIVIGLLSDESFKCYLLNDVFLKTLWIKNFLILTLTLAIISCGDSQPNNGGTTIVGNTSTSPSTQHITMVIPQ